MLVETLLLLSAIYLLFGLLFAIAFAVKGVTVVDEGAHGSSTGFRIIIFPGAVLLWPLLLKKWIYTKSTKHDETT